MYIRNSASGSDVYTNKVSIYLKKTIPPPEPRSLRFTETLAFELFFCFSNGYFFKDNFLNIFLPVKKKILLQFTQEYTLIISISCRPTWWS